MCICSLDPNSDDEGGVDPISTGAPFPSDDGEIDDMFVEVDLSDAGSTTAGVTMTGSLARLAHALQAEVAGAAGTASGAAESCARGRAQQTARASCAPRRR